jgi:hypothetical protein
LRYQVDTTSSGHNFYGGLTLYATINSSGITVDNGSLISNNITASTGNNLSLNAPSGETINFDINNTTYAQLTSSSFSISGGFGVETSGNYGVFPTSTNSTGSSETRPFNYSVTYFIKW